MSIAVRFGNSVWICVTKPMVRLRKIDICLSFNVVTSLPASRIEPDVGFSNPVTRLSKVLLPFPDLPTIGHEFAWIEREIHVIHRGERFASAYEFTGKATNLQYGLFRHHSPSLSVRYACGAERRTAVARDATGP